MSEFARMRNGMKSPAQLARANVECPDIAGRSGKRFRIPSADDEQIFVNNARTGHGNGLCSGRLAAKILAKIDAPIMAEFRNGLAGGCVQGIYEIHDACEDARRLAVGPVGQSTIW